MLEQNSGNEVNTVANGQVTGLRIGGVPTALNVDSVKPQFLTPVQGEPIAILNVKSKHDKHESVNADTTSSNDSIKQSKRLDANGVGIIVREQPLITTTVSVRNDALPLHTGQVSHLLFVLN